MNEIAALVVEYLKALEEIGVAEKIEVKK